MKKSKKELTVLVVELPDELSSQCEESTEANVTVDAVNSFEVALDKINGGHYNMVLLSSNTYRYVELIAAAKVQNPAVVILGFSNDSTSRSLMVDDDCDAVTSLDKAEDEIEQWLERLAK